MTKFTKTFFVGISVAMLSVVLLWAQTRIQRPVNNQTGYSAGISYSSGGNVTTQLFNGEVMVLTDQGTDAGPILRVYDGINAAWQGIASEYGAGEFITFEGATADAFETIFTVEDPTIGDGTFHLPNNAAAADTYALAFSVLDTNALDAANSIWMISNNIVFEAATANGFETMITVADTVTGDVTVTIPIDNAQWAGTGTVMLSNLATNAPDVANGVWGVSNGIHYEGATQDDWENSLQSADVGQDQIAYFGDYGEAATSVIHTLLDGMDLDEANSVWFSIVGGLTWEGAGVDAFESVLIAEDPTVAVNTFQLMDRLGGPGAAADIYQIAAVPDVTQTTANLFYGNDEDAVAVAAQADDVMIVRRIYVPHAITVTHVDLLNNDLANVSAADNTISVAIYYDDDAGPQLVELVGATDDGAGATTGLYTLDITDTLLLPGWYRVGMCAQDASDNDIEVQQAQADILTLVAGGALATEFTSTAAANPCVNGDPNALTGVLTQDADSLTFVLRAQ